MPPATLHPGQTRLIRDYTKRDHLILAGVGYGKTIFGPRWHFERVLKHKYSKESLIIAPNNRLLKRCFRIYVEHLESCGLREGREFEFNRSEIFLRFMLKEPGRVKEHLAIGITGESPDRLVSYSASHIWRDESALLAEEIARKSLQRLRCDRATAKRQILDTTTPEGLNWLFERFNPEKVIRGDTIFSEGPNQLVLHGRSHDNPYLDDEYLRETLEQEFGWDDRYYSNYVLAEWVSLVRNAFYFGFDQRRNITETKPDQEIRTLYFTFDNNVGKLAWVAMQGKGAEWHCVAANRARARNLQEACEEIIAAFPPAIWGQHAIRVLGDAVLHHRSNQTYTTGFQVIESLLRPHYPDFRVILPAGSGNSLVEERSRRTNSLLSKGLLKIDASCTSVITSVKTAESKTGGGIKKAANDDVTHPMEAVDHALIVLEPLKARKVSGTVW